MCFLFLLNGQKSGIYRISNSIDGRIYIGSSKSLIKRFDLHKKSLVESNKKHHSSHLENFSRKYPDVCFIFEVIEIVEDLSLLLEREQHYLDTLKPFGKNGFNIKRKAANSNGFIRASKDKPFNQYDRNGLINKFSNMREAHEKTGFNKNTIRGVLCGNFKSCNGFIFSYESLSQNDLIEIYSDKRKTRFSRPTKNQKVRQFCSEFGEIIYNSVREAAKKLGCCDISIRRACRNKSNYKNSKWEYLPKS